MFGWEIDLFLRKDSHCRLAFHNGGLYFPENLPLDIQYPAIFVINVQLLQAGKHWVAVYIDAFKRGYYFDSFGLPPSNDKIIVFLQRVTCVWKNSLVSIQCVTSKKCGIFCLYFLYYKSRGWSLEQILQPFYKFGVLKNDSFISTWFQNRSLSRTL